MNYTNQTAFTAVTLALLKQNEKSIRAGRCRYRGYGNLKCAIGHLIPDEEYTPSLEHGFLSEVLVQVPSLRNLSFGLLSELQHVHDRKEPSEWADSLKDIALRYCLEYPDGQNL